MRKSMTFFSEGVRLAGDLYLPDDLARGEKRAGIVLCHGYTGVRNLYLFLPPLTSTTSGVWIIGPARPPRKVPAELIDGKQRMSVSALSAI
jgi:hypothetical protein